MKKTIIVLIAALMIIIGLQSVAAENVTHNITLDNGVIGAAGMMGMFINVTDNLCLYNLTKNENNTALYCYVYEYNHAADYTVLANDTFNGSNTCNFDNLTSLYIGKTYAVGTSSDGPVVNRAYSSDHGWLTTYAKYVTWEQGMNDFNFDTRYFNVEALGITTTSCGNIDIDNCSTYTTPSHNFTVYNGSSQTTVSLQGLAEIQRDHIDYGVDNNPAQYHQFCINPFGGSDNVNLTLVFSNTSYVTKNIAYQSLLMNNNLNTTYIEMLLLSDATDITITVVDQNEDVLAGYLVETWKYNLTTDSLYLYESQYTNGVGQIVVPLKVAEEQYEFYVRDGDNALLYTEQRSTLTETSYTFRVILEGVTSNPILSLADLEYNFTASRTDYYFKAEWNDDKGVASAFMLETIFHNITDSVVYNMSNSTATGGVFIHNLSGSMTGRWVSTFYAQSTIDGQWYVIDGDDLDYREAWSVFGDDSIFMAFFFIGTILFLGISTHPVISLVMAGLGLVAFSIMGFVKLAMGGLIGAVVMLLVMAFMVRRNR